MIGIAVAVDFWREFGFESWFEEMVLFAGEQLPVETVRISGRVL